MIAKFKGLALAGVLGILLLAPAGFAVQLYGWYPAVFPGPETPKGGIQLYGMHAVFPGPEMPKGGVQLYGMHAAFPTTEVKPQVMAGAAVPTSGTVSYGPEAPVGVVFPGPEMPKGAIQLYGMHAVFPGR